MSTTDDSDSKIIPSKLSPFCKGINKSLLTPCRQIGLSRKRKTPVSSLSKHSSEDLNLTSNTSINSTNSYSENETTPITYTKQLSNRRIENLSALNGSPACTPTADSEREMKTEGNDLQKHCNPRILKRKLLQTFTSDDLFDSNDDIPYCVEKNESSTEKVTCFINMNTECISDAEFLKDINEVPVPHTFENMNNIEMRNSTAKTLTKDFVDVKQNYLLNKSDNHSTRTKIISDSDDDFVFSKGSNNTKKERKLKSIKNTLSQRQSSLETDNLSQSNCVKKLKVELQKLSENDVTCVENNYVETCVKTLTRKSSSNFTDDADFFTSTPEEEKLKRKYLEKKMRVLEKEVKQKQLLLENLQRASIYKSKHNIQDLKLLTTIWLQGCGQALKDLLTQLQAHSSIDLNTLLNNMKVPKEIVAKLPLT